MHFRDLLLLSHCFHFKRLGFSDIVEYTSARPSQFRNNLKNGSSNNEEENRGNNRAMTIVLFDLSKSKVLICNSQPRNTWYGMGDAQ